MTACPLCAADSTTVDFEGPDVEFGGDEVFTYLGCQSCGAVFQDPMPDVERLGDFYPDDYAQYRPQRAKTPRALERAVLGARYGYAHLYAPGWARALAPIVGMFKYRTAVPWVEGGHLLDVGCGNGKFLLTMQALGWNVAGIDFDERSVRVCRDAGLDVRRAAITDSSLPQDGFDVVSARHVIEHVRDPDAFVAAAKRLLRPGGVLHVRTPNMGALGRSRFGGHWYGHQVPRHVVMFRPDNLDRLLTQHGFTRRLLRTRATPKMLLNSKDLVRGERALPSRHRRFARLLAKPHVWAARLTDRGDEIIATYGADQG